ncbi:biotin transporter BioY [Lachnospiraceae bacterium NSJ-143]|nr:biotin transporter BioY [Lachnospiraceae bacterium NSJ-143]
MKNEVSQNRVTAHEMTYCAISAAVMCILGPMSIPIGAVPVSFTNLVIYISVFILGMKRTAISYLIYLFIGAFGLPVFSGYTGGFAKFAGPTGGYLIGFIFMSLICGFFAEKFKNKLVIVFGMILATAVAYAFGTAWFVAITESGWGYAFGICVLPFIFGDIVKILISMLAGPAVERRLKKAEIS